MYKEPFPNAGRTWSNVTKHALNSLYALFEVVVPRTEPMPWWHIIPLVLILCGYLGVAYITKATQGFFTYSFLDNELHSPGIVAAYIVGILVGAIVFFVVIRTIVVLRDWLTERRPGKVGGKRSKRDNMGGEMSGGVPMAKTEEV